MKTHNEQILITKNNITMQTDKIKPLNIGYVPTLLEWYLIRYCGKKPKRVKKIKKINMGQIL